MKKIALSGLAVALLIPALTLAHAEKEMDRPGSMMGGRPEIAEKLGLTDAQKAKFKDTMKAHREAMRPLMMKMHETMKTLREQADKKAPDADIKATLAALKDQRKQMASAQEKYHESLAEFLTPTQQAAFILGAERGGRGGMEGGRGRWGKRGGSDRESPRESHGDDD